MSKEIEALSQPLLADIKRLIDEARSRVTTKINVELTMLYERSAISKKPEETIAHDLQALRQKHKVSPDFLLKDPYVLDFLGLDDRYIEKNLEDAILREMERFLLELGAGFTFVAR